MVTSAEIKKKLEEVFDERQAAVLAEVFVDAYGELVKTSDFDGLKAIVKELAEAQARTEQRVGELAEAQARTEQRVGELAEVQARTEQRVGELAEAQRRTEEGLQRQGEQIQSLIEAQRRTEEGLQRQREQIQSLIEAQRRTEEGLEALSQAQRRTEEELRWLVSWQRGEAGRRDGERYERETLRRAPMLFNGGRGGPPDEAWVQQRLTELLTPVLGDLLETEEDPFLADLLWWKGEQMAVVEISVQVNGDDVARAAQRAGTLRRAGVKALAIVIGEDWAVSDAQDRALARQVEWKVGSDLSAGFLTFRRLQ